MKHALLIVNNYVSNQENDELLNCLLKTNLSIIVTSTSFECDMRLFGLDKESAYLLFENIEKGLSKKEIVDIYKRIINGDYSVSLNSISVKNKEVFSVQNVESLLISKYIGYELRKKYKLKMSNRDEIVEELRVLLDNSMPKILIRTDIKDFFESIDQKRLLEKIRTDGLLFTISEKCLRKFFYEYNQMKNNKNQVGLPRGLSFSPVLAEIYLQDFDRKIKNLNGVYFYKRYVDDIVILANPQNITKENCWNSISKISSSFNLTLHNDDEKQLKELISGRNNRPFYFDYLGYRFRHSDGHTDLLLTEKKMERYKKTIDCIFKAYAKVASYRTRDEKGKKHTDGIIQFMHRIEALTGNGKLNSRRNFVKTGLYYSNHLLTDISQIDDLDKYLTNALNDPKRFAPPRNLFNYGNNMDYERAVSLIKSKIINIYSFKKGYCERRLYRWDDYVIVLKQLQNLYFKSLQ